MISSLDSLRILAAPPWVLRAGNALDVVPTLPRRKFRTIVTSPPYFLKRAYDVPPTVWGGAIAPTCTHEWQPITRKGVSGGSGDASAKLKARKNVDNFQIVPNQAQASCTACGAWSGQLGLEPSLQGYLNNLRSVYAACRDALTDDGTLWVVIDDSMAGSGRGPSGHNAAVPNQTTRQGFDSHGAYIPDGLKPKDMMGVPYELAKLLRQDGWYWRADIIWHKPNGFGNATDDRPTHTYEHVLLFSKARRYFANYLGLQEPTADGEDTRVLRDIWSISSEPTGHAHFAAYPTELARRCIRIGSEPGDWVLDPTAGICRTGIAAMQLRRGFVGVDLGEQYLRWGAESLREYR